MVEDKVKYGIAAGLAGAAAALAATTLYNYVKGSDSATKASATQPAIDTPHPESMVAVIGDVGGTNVRLTLRRLNLRTRTSTEVRPLTKFPSQDVKHFADALGQFLKDIDRSSPNYPRIGVIGIAGEVKNNVVCTTNVPHWKPTDGLSIAQEFGMEDFVLVNDFVAAGHGLLQLKEKDYDQVNRAPIEEGGVKVVMGPGTGHGQGFLVKSKFSPCYDVYPSEGGHTEFAPRNEEDWRLMQFAFNYIENSNNIENKRGKKKIARISHERLGAGPAIPLIYEFMKKEHASLERVIESGEDAKAADDINSHDVINQAMANNDPLCTKVVDKFSEILAVQTGDTALKYLPYGGIYLVGGVTMGIRDKLLSDKNWIEAFYAKGRLNGVMHRFPVMILNPNTELGILGAEEVAYRLCGCYAAQ